MKSREFSGPDPLLFLKYRLRPVLPEPGSSLFDILVRAECEPKFYNISTNLSILYLTSRYFIFAKISAFFIKYLQDKITLTEDEVKMIYDVSIHKKLRRKQFLLQDGNVWKYNAFVCSGFLKTFSIDEKGLEHIIKFAPENYWTGDRESLVNGTPERFNIDAIKDAEIILIEKTNFANLCKHIPQLNDLVNAILQRSFIMSKNRIQANISFTAEEKYQNFLDKFPSIANRIPQHMIASYIGITPETLTRIRRNAVRK